MDMETLRSWLIQKGISPNELDRVEPAPIVGDVGSLQSENSNLLFQNAMQDMSIQSLQNENADLMIKIAMLETGGKA